jgi:hypothetical protein
MESIQMTITRLGDKKASLILQNIITFPYNTHSEENFFFTIKQDALNWIFVSEYITSKYHATVNDLVVVIRLMQLIKEPFDIFHEIHFMYCGIGLLQVKLPNSKTNRIVVCDLKNFRVSLLKHDIGYCTIS